MTVPTKIAGLAIQSWSYKAQDPSIRLLGPVAEDFYAAFRLGEADHRITTTDIDGVNMLAIQALERRTTDLRSELAATREENRVLRERLDRLEAMLATRRDERLWPDTVSSAAERCADLRVRAALCACGGFAGDPVW